MNETEKKLYSEAVDALAKETVDKIDRFVALSASARFDVEKQILIAFGKLIGITKHSMFPETETVTVSKSPNEK